jgi:hypothetical protein
MDMDTLYRDRRPPEVIDARRAYREQERGSVEQDPEQIVQPEPMGEDVLLDSLRFPSAHPGPGAMVMGRVRDRDLCRHCGMPLFSHGDRAFEHHIPEPLANGRRTPGVGHDVEDGRARTSSGPRPTPRRDLD